MRINHLTPADWTHVDPGPLQRVARRLLTRPGRALYRFRGYGHMPRVPEAGGFLLAPGPHGAYLDPLIIALGQPRARLRFMAKYQVLEWPLVGRMVRSAGAFPVVRGGGRSGAALEVAQAVIESGDGLVIFMEGRMVLEHSGLGVPRTGLPRMALATGVPVVPVALHGAKRARAYGRRWWWHWPRVTVVWGEPMSFPREAAPSDERIDEVRDAIWAEVTRLNAIADAIVAAPGRHRPRQWRVPSRVQAAAGDELGGPA